MVFFSKSVSKDIAKESRRHHSDNLSIPQPPREISDDLLSMYGINIHMGSELMRVQGGIIGGVTGISAYDNRNNH
jgi:hypothetical protein